MPYSLQYLSISQYTEQFPNADFSLGLPTMRNEGRHILIFVSCCQTDLPLLLHLRPLPLYLFGEVRFLFFCSHEKIFRHDATWRQQRLLVFHYTKSILKLRCSLANWNAGSKMNEHGGSAMFWLWARIWLLSSRGESYIYCIQRYMIFRQDILKHYRNRIISNSSTSYPNVPTF